MAIALNSTSSLADAEALKRRGDFLFYVGCLVCGTWILGIIGAPILVYGAYLLRQAELKGVAIRPWSVTLVGGLILVDASVNYLAWGLDWLPSNQSWLVRSLWINYGMFGDGTYALFYNLPSHTDPRLPEAYNNATYIWGGNGFAGEKVFQIAFMLLVMPIRIGAAWGLLHMKRWGLQWSVIGNWCYLVVWAAYTPFHMLTFEQRFGTSEFGVLGFWAIGGLPFLGPLVLLPYLHTVNRELWSE